MKDNIYIKALEMGYNNNEGISFDQVVEALGIKENLNNRAFKTNFTIWFYSNFYNVDAEPRVLINKTGVVKSFIYEIDEDNVGEFDDFNHHKSFIKGESTQKYIDYLELKESRETSQTAKKISYISIGIAIASIFLSPFISRVIPESPKQVIVTENRDKTNDAAILERLTKIDSTINSAITKLSLIAEKKVEVAKKNSAKVKPVKH